jgi:hypothetical protein
MTEQFQFTEREEYEDGFSKVYDAKIAPYFREKEAERQAAIKRSYQWICVVGLVTIWLAWKAMKVDPILPIFPIFFGGCTALYLYLSRLGKVQREMTSVLRPILCDFFPDMVYSDLHPGESFSVSRLRDLNIIPSSDQRRFGPSIAGRWRDTPYRLTKASFFNQRRDQDGDRKIVHLFSGIILEIECLIEMPTIVFYPDYGETMNSVYGWATRNNRPPHKMGFADPIVEDVFEIYTDDLEKAQVSLNQNFGLKLLDFSRKHQRAEKHIAAAFQGKKFYLAIDLPHDFMSFDVGSRPLSQANEAIHKALADLMIPRQVIDELLDPGP